MLWVRVQKCYCQNRLFLLYMSGASDSKAQWPGLTPQVRSGVTWWLFTRVGGGFCCLSAGTSHLHCCCCSIIQSCLTLSDPLDCNARPPCPSPSPEVCPSSCPLHRWCHPAISSSVALFSFCLQFFPASGSFPMSHTFASEDQNTGASAQHQSLQWVFRVDLPWLVWSPCCPRDFQESSPAPRFEGIDSLVLCLLYSPALTTIRDHWEDRSLTCTYIQTPKMTTLYGWSGFGMHSDWVPGGKVPRE